MSIVPFLEVDDGVPLYVIEASPSGDYWMDFTVQRTMAWGSMGIEAEEALKGYVKWDGCCEFELLESHYCTREGVKNLAALLVKVHELAAELIPRWSKELAE